jgi:carbonic anhydrase/acetyltransferase-like protein (isoleucine patch superfamily)
MPQYPYRGKRPVVAHDAWIAPTACLIGDVTVESGSSVWFNATLRGDMASIRIGPRTSVQDNVVVHTEADGPTIIGADCTIGHGAIVHDSTIGDNVLIGSGAVLVGGNRIGERSVIAAGAVLPERMAIAERKVAVGVPARVIRDVGPGDDRWTVDAAEHYTDLARWYRENLDQTGPEGSRPLPDEAAEPPRP